MAGRNESRFRPALGECFIDLLAFVSAPELSGNVSRATIGIPLIEFPLSFTYFLGDIPPSPLVVPEALQAFPGLSHEQVGVDDVFVLTNAARMPTEGLVSLCGTFEIACVSEKNLV